MGYYEQRRKIAEELSIKLADKPSFNRNQIEVLEAQLVAFYGLPKKAAKELIEAQIVIGNLKVID